MNIRRFPALVPAIAVLAVLFGGAAAWGQCPASTTSPNYTPDFSSVPNQSCLTLNTPSMANPYPGFYAPAYSVSPPPNTPNPAQPAPANVTTVLRLTPNSGGQAGSAFFTAQQSVAGAFSTTFTFQLSATTVPSDGPADGIAFVIQNSALTALGPDGCGMGFADGSCTAAEGGISNSLAVAFKTFNDGYPNPNNNSVLIQSYGTGANCIDQAACNIAYNNNLLPATGTVTTNGTTVTWATGSYFNTSWVPGTTIFINGVPFTIASVASTMSLTVTAAPTAFEEPVPYSVATLADGNVHSATITYKPSGVSTCGQEGTTNCSSLDVILDGVDLFPGGVLVDLSSLLSLPSGNAWVGFTAATGGGNENQDILSWTFTPESQSGMVSTTSPTILSFQNDAYNYFAQLNSGSPTAITVTPMLTAPGTCDALVQLTYPGAHCFVYTNLGSNPDSAVLFNLTCPAMSNNQCNPFSAELGTNYALSTEGGVNLFNPTDPFPGWLKGNGGVAGNPCQQQNNNPLFQSNQIDTFSLTMLDPGSKGGSGGTGSCWVATYAQPDETLSVITITSPTSTSYAQNASVPASYTCATPTSTVPNLPEATSPVGPYLTVASCTQSTGTQASCTTTAAGQSCTGGTVDTSTVGPHTFTVKAMDTGTNTSTQSVNYNVVAATNLQIVNVGTPGTAATGSLISYNIGVADLGPANAVGVMVIDQLPTNTSFVSASGSNVSCTVVSKKLVCTTTPVSCSGGSTVSCNVGTLAPLSISSLNGAAMKITVKVTSQPATMCKVGSAQKPCTIDTATVSADNTDTNPHPSSTVQTIY